MTRRFGWKIPWFDLHDDDQEAVSKAGIERQLHFDHLFRNGFIRLPSNSKNRAKDTHRKQWIDWKLLHQKTCKRWDQRSVRAVFSFIFTLVRGLCMTHSSKTANNIKSRRNVTNVPLSGASKLIALTDGECRKRGVTFFGVNNYTQEEKNHAKEQSTKEKHPIRWHHNATRLP